MTSHYDRLPRRAVTLAEALAAANRDADPNYFAAHALFVEAFATLQRSRCDYHSAEALGFMVDYLREVIETEDGTDCREEADA
jgi:hypothetical protein